jgi:hypothetical protein
MITIEEIGGKLDKEIAFFFSVNKINVPNRQITYEKFLEDKMLIIVDIRTGIPYSLFDLIQNYTPFSESDWADFLNISTKSLHIYALGKLKPIELLKDSYGKEMVIGELNRINHGILV